MNDHYARNPDHVRALKRARTYRITPERQWAMYHAQGGRCANAGCLAPLTFREAEVDHDHACCAGSYSCGLCVRAFLCCNCNSVLGHVKDDPRRLRGLADYLEVDRRRG